MVKNKTLSNMLWRFAERCGAQGVSFIVSIVLARVLAPEVYGTIALVTVFTTILEVFINSGLGNALIQKKDADELDFSSVFYFNFVMCLFLYAVMYIIAPTISNFYNDNSLTSIVRVLSLTLIISGIKNIQQAYVSKNMLFRKFFFSTIGGTIISAIIGIVMAFMGYGVWALVAQQMVNKVTDTIILWVTVKWRPKLMFSFNRLLVLLKYGWKLLASSLLDAIYNNVRQLIIGKVYSSTDLAFYNKGKEFPNIAITNLNTSIDSVLFPVMASAQDDLVKVKELTRKSIQISSYVIWPMMVGLAVCAEPLILLLLTDRWVESVPYMQLFCISFAFWPIHTANLNAIKAVGRSDLFLKLEIIKKIIGIISILVFLPFGVFWIAIGYTVTSPISGIINAYPNRSLLGYSFKEQITDMLPPMILSIFMGVLVYFINFLPLSLYIKLLVQIIFGVIIYIIGSLLFKLQGYNYFLKIIIKFKGE